MWVWAREARGAVEPLELALQAVVSSRQCLALDIFHSEDKSRTGLCDAYRSRNPGLVSPGHTSWMWRASSHFPACFHLSSLSSVPGACLGLCHHIPVPLLWSLGCHIEESSERIGAEPYHRPRRAFVFQTGSVNGLSGAESGCGLRSRWRKKRAPSVT